MRKHRLIGIIVALAIVGGAIVARPSGAQTSNTAYRTTNLHSAGSQYVAGGTSIARFVADATTAQQSPQNFTYQDQLKLEADTVKRQQYQQYLVALAQVRQQQAAAAAAAAQAAAAAAQRAQVAQTAAPPATDVWAELRQCESGGNYAENTGNGYYGTYQFSLSTWEGLGYSGLPSDASPQVQDAAAQALQARSGWGQWPGCSRRLGLS